MYPFNGSSVFIVSYAHRISYAVIRASWEHSIATKRTVRGFYAPWILLFNENY